MQWPKADQPRLDLELDSSRTVVGTVEGRRPALVGTDRAGKAEHELLVRVFERAVSHQKPGLDEMDDENEVYPAGRVAVRPE